MATVPAAHGLLNASMENPFDKISVSFHDVSQNTGKTLLHTFDQKAGFTGNGKHLHRDVQYLLSSEVTEFNLVNRQGLNETATGLLSSGLVREMTAQIENSYAQSDKSGLAVNAGSLDVLNRPTPANAINNRVQVSLDAQFNQGNWSNALAGRVVLLAAENIQSAQISLNPPELGPVEVRISQSGEQTNVQFYAQHSQVRDAIEDSFSRLRDLMSQSGLSLGDANVTDQSLTDNSETGNEELSASVSGDSGTEADTGLPTQQATQISSSLYDYYV